MLMIIVHPSDSASLHDSGKEGRVHRDDNGLNEAYLTTNTKMYDLRRFIQAVECCEPLCEEGE